MTAKRSRAAATAQTKLLRRLGVARDKRPGPRSGTITPRRALSLAVLCAAEALATTTRLSRMAAGSDADEAHRKTIVVVNAITDALAAGIKGDPTLLERLYHRVVAPQEDIEHAYADR